MALGTVARREGSWNESVAYFEQALALDPRNVDLLNRATMAYANFRQFPAALKLCDRVLDITPNDLDMMGTKACIYQAQGNLSEAARLLIGINEQTPNSGTFGRKINQLQYERNYEEAVRLLQARLAQFHYPSEGVKGGDQASLAYTQRLAGDTAGAKVSAGQALKALEQLEDQPNDLSLALHMAGLSQVYALMGEKDSALKAAQRAVMLVPRAKDPLGGPHFEENLAVIQTICGESDRAISILAQLLQTSYTSLFYSPASITPALLRIDPIWDPLRGDPAFQKLCEEKIDKSIAVLPFENLSRDSDNAYFAEGIQEEILTRLANIGDLKVISRTSTQRYQSKPRDLGEIAKQLGVANILEGSVQKAADQVRVNVQLINAQTDSHLWADSYDRKLTDIFSVESEIAKGIAAALQAKLTGREEQALAVKPTNNPEAYDAYLRGLAFDARTMARQASDSYARAVQVDPNFALAWARLSRAEGYLYFGSNDNTGRDAAKRALENAQRLEPNSSESLLALGYYQHLVLRDNALAKTTFERVRKLSPSSSDVPFALGRVARREGQWDQSIVCFQQALALDPRNSELLWQAAMTFTCLRQFPTALKLYDRMLDITPNNLDVIERKARIYQAQGNLLEAARVLSGINWQNPSGEVLSDQLRLERNYSEAIRFLQALIASLPADESPGFQGDLALTQLAAGDSAGAKVTAQQALNTFEPLYREKPDDIFLTRHLAYGYALIGKKDLALKFAEHAVMLKPRAKDAASGPTFEESLAVVQTLVGENSRAISTLTQLLQTPYFGNWYKTPITPALLRLDPIWDPLRSDPGFQKLCEENQP